MYPPKSFVFVCLSLVFIALLFIAWCIVIEKLKRKNTLCCLAEQIEYKSKYHNYKVDSVEQRGEFLVISGHWESPIFMIDFFRFNLDHPDIRILKRQPEYINFKFAKANKNNPTENITDLLRIQVEDPR